MNQVDEAVFFAAMYKALIDEDQSLRTLFEANAPLYYKQHNGISCLYETTVVYLVFKQLLKEKFNYCLSWEYPYPGNTILKADLALLRNNQDCDSLVEFKIWTSEKGDEVRWDVMKYLRTSFAGGKYLAIVELGGPDIIANSTYLSQMNPEMEILETKSFTTRFFDSSATKQLTDKSINLYFLKMKDSINQDLS